MTDLSPSSPIERRDARVSYRLAGKDGAEITNLTLLQGNCHRLVHVIYLNAVNCRLRNRGLLKA
jgi:hypothetical protein